MEPVQAEIADIAPKMARRRVRRTIVGVVILCALAATVPLACRAMRPAGGENSMMKIREDMTSIEAAGEEYPESVQLYFAHYGLDMGEGVRHRFGTFASGEWTLAGHVYEPAEYRGTVILLHGYLNHCGQFRHLVRRLLDEGYAVAMYDMPGHGLSTGRRAVIEDFSQYTDTLGDFADVVGGLVHGPYDLIGFSTGGTVVMDWMLMRDGARFRRVVLAGPLVRSPGWQSSVAGAKFYGNFSDTVPRWPRRNSGDPEYIKFNRRQDVLHCREVSLRWMMALHAWNERMAKHEPCGHPVKVIQGTKNTTVAYKYNIQFIRRMFPAADVTMIEGGRHELFNEAAALRQEVLDVTVAYLNAGEGSDADDGQSRGVGSAAAESTQ